MRFFILTIFSLFLIGSQPIAAQDWQSLQNQLITQLSEYRSQLIMDEPQRINDLDNLIQRTKRLGLQDENRASFLYELFLMAYYEDGSYEEFSEYYLEKNKYLKKKVHLTHAEFEAVNRNKDLIDLMFMDVLLADYPFAINGEAEFIKELEFYNLKEGDRIGEIGAGDGMFSFLLAMMSEKMNITINDKESHSMDEIQSKIERNRTLVPLDHVAIVEGDASSTNFPINSMDKIIIRRALHHFSRVKPMFSSIKKSLRPSGELLIYEYPYEYLRSTGDMCPKTLRVEHILEMLKKNGFEIVDRLKMGESLLLKCRVAEN